MAGKKRYRCGTCGEKRSFDELAEISVTGEYILCCECAARVKAAGGIARVTVDETGNVTNVTPLAYAGPGYVKVPKAAETVEGIAFPATTGAARIVDGKMVSVLSDD